MTSMWPLVAMAVMVVACSGEINQDWWESALIYQIYTRSFQDSNRDGIGDIKGITSRLAYFKELNVDAICLSPIFKSPLDDFGFDVSDYYNVHPEYGTNEDLEDLVQRASRSNIKVLLDFVPNHTSNESDWFTKSVANDEYYSDWYVWADGYLDNHGKRSPPNNWISVFKKTAWEHMPAKDQFYLHQFGTSQPDLNLRNPVVIDELKTAMKFWLDKGVAGMRMSSVNHMFEVDKDMFGGRYPDEPKSGKVGVEEGDYKYLNHIYTKDLSESYELISQFRELFHGVSLRDNMTRIIITESSPTNIKNSVKYYGEGKQSGGHIPVNMALMDEFRKESDARDLKHAIDRWLTYKPQKKPANWMIGNHDKARVASRFRPELVDAFNMLVLLLPGIAFTYMGEELGMVNGHASWVETMDPLACRTDDPVNYVTVTRDIARTPFQWSSERNAGFSTGHKTWLPLADGYESLNVDAEKAAARSHLLLYKTLSELRKRNTFRVGRFECHALSHTVFAFKRWHQDDTYVVVMNLGRTMNVVDLSSFDLVFGQLMVEASSTLSSRSKDEVVAANHLELAPDEALVLWMMV